MVWWMLLPWGVAAVVLIAAVWRQLDRLGDDKIWQRLIDAARTTDEVFDRVRIADLPEPARRYFLYTIRPGTPLRLAVEIMMTGELGFGTKEDPDYRPMSAHQLLAPPHGLVWKLDCGAIGGSDGATADTSWTRFWLFGLLPIVRAGGNDDHLRSAFGRVVAEAAIWAPASLLPGKHVRWESVDGSTARAVVTNGTFEQAVEITVAQDGQPVRVVIPRWSNENAEREFREQPFGGELARFRDFHGYRLPTEVDGGNLIGTDDYFPFFKARVGDVRLPAPGP